MCTSRLTTGMRRVFWSTTKATRATGMPKKKHQRQPTVSTSRPPTSGPEIVAIAKTAPM